MRYTHPAAAATKSEYCTRIITYKKIIKSHFSEQNKARKTVTCCTHDKKLEKGNLSKQDEVLLLAFVRNIPVAISLVLLPFFQILPSPFRDIHRPSQTSTRKNTLPTDSLFSCRRFIWSTVSYTKSVVEKIQSFFCQCPPRGSKLIVLEPSQDK